MKHAETPIITAFECKYTHTYKIDLNSELIRNLMKDTQTNIQGLVKKFNKLLKTNRNTKTNKVFTFKDALYLLVVTEHKDKRMEGCELVNISGFGLTEFIITCGKVWSLRIHGETLFEINDATQYFLSINWPNELKSRFPSFVGKHVMFYENAAQKCRNDSNVMLGLENGLHDLNRLTKTLHGIRDKLSNKEERKEPDMDMRREMTRLKKENDELSNLMKKTNKQLQQSEITLKKIIHHNETLVKENEDCKKLQTEVKNMRKKYSSLKSESAIIVKRLNNAENTVKGKKEKIAKLFNEKSAMDQENTRNEKRIKKLEKDYFHLREKLQEKNKEYELLETAWKSISNKPRKQFFDIISKVCPYHDLKDMGRLVEDIKMLYDQCNTKEDIFFVFRHLHLKKEDKETCMEYIDRLETMHDCLNKAKPANETWHKFASRLSTIEERFKSYKENHVKKSILILKEHRKLREFGLRNLMYAYTYEYVLKGVLERFQSHRDDLTGLFDTISKRITGNVRFFQNGDISSDVKVLSQMYASIMARNYLFRQELDTKGELFDKHRKHLWNMKTGELIFLNITKTIPDLETECILREESTLSINTGIRMYDSPIGHTSFSWKWRQQDMVGHTKFSSGHTTFTAYQIDPEKKGFFKVKKHSFCTYKHISIRNMRTVINRRFKNDIKTPVVFFHAKITESSLEIQDIQSEDTYLDSLEKPLYFYTCFKNFE